MAVTPGGILTRSLAGAVADELGVPRAVVSPRAVQVALGLMIATGRVDEVGGRLVAVSQEQRRAG